MNTKNLKKHQIHSSCKKRGFHWGVGTSGLLCRSLEVTMNILEHNRIAWNRESSTDSPWVRPVEASVIQDVKKGSWEVILTPNKTAPRHWFGELQVKKVLCLASGGGQQAPILATVGASVVSFDLSDEQLAKDRLVSERDDLDVRCD